MNGIISKVKSQPGAVFFDAAGTLIRLEKPVGWHYAKIVARHGLKVSETRMEQAFRSAWAAQAPRKSGPRADDDKGWWEQLAGQTLEKAGTVPPDFPQTAWFEDLYEHFTQPGVWVLWDDVLPALEFLHDSFPLAVLSNFDGRLRRILHDLEIDKFFEKMFISSEIGSDKPDRSIFLKAADGMGQFPANCLHVGDDPTRDWQGAKDAGFSVFSLHRPKNSLRELPGLLGIG